MAVPVLELPQILPTIMIDYDAIAQRCEAWERLEEALATDIDVGGEWYDRCKALVAKFVLYALDGHLKCDIRVLLAENQELRDQLVPEPELKRLVYLSVGMGTCTISHATELLHQSLEKTKQEFSIWLQKEAPTALTRQTTDA